MGKTMLINDKPITNETEDLLGRDFFARELSDMINNYCASNNDCLVIGLQGEWGSGKTSLLNLLKKHSSSEKQVIFFNAWLSSDRLTLVQEFFKHITQGLPEKDVVREKMKKYASSISRSLARGVSISASYAGTPGIPINAGMSISLDKIVDPYKEESLQDQKEKIAKILGVSDIKSIVYIIDDIDRLSDVEIAIVFNLVKNIADFKKIIYILAYDRAVIATALNNVQKDRGNDYLQKIVQLPVNIPAPDEDRIYDYFFKKINIIIAGLQSVNFDREHFNEIIHSSGIKKYIKNIRDCNRIINSFNIKYCLFGHDCDIGDLLTITILEILEPDLFELIKSNKFNLCGVREQGFGELQKDVADKLLVELKKSVHIIGEDELLNIIGVLFPKFYGICSGTCFTYSNSLSPVATNKISSKESFGRYFRLALEQTEVATDDIFNLLTQDKFDSETYFKKCNLEGKIKRMMDKATSILKDAKKTGLIIEKDRVINIIEALSKVELQEKYSFLDADVFSYRKWFVKALVFACWDKPDAEYLRAIFNDRIISLPIKEDLLINISEGQKWVYGAQEFLNGEKVISTHDFNELENIFLDLAEYEIKTGKIFSHNQYYLYMTFHIWNKRRNNEYEAFIKSYQNQYEQALRILIFVHKNIVNGNENESYWFLSDDWPSNLLDKTECFEAMRDFMNKKEFSALDNQQKRYIAAFVLYMMNHTDKEKYEVTYKQVEEYLESIEEK